MRSSPEERVRAPIVFLVFSSSADKSTRCNKGHTLFQPSAALMLFICQDFAKKTKNMAKRICSSRSIIYGLLGKTSKVTASNHRCSAPDPFNSVAKLSIHKYGYLIHLDGYFHGEFVQPCDGLPGVLLFG